MLASLFYKVFSWVALNISIMTIPVYQSAHSSLGFFDKEGSENIVQ